MENPQKWREKSLLALDGIKSEIALSLGMGAKVLARRNWMMTCLECEELILGSSKAGTAIREYSKNALKLIY